MANEERLPTFVEVTEVTVKGERALVGSHNFNSATAPIGTVAAILRALAEVHPETVVHLGTTWEGVQVQVGHLDYPPEVPAEPDPEPEPDDGEPEGAEAEPEPALAGATP